MVGHGRYAVADLCMGLVDMLSPLRGHAPQVPVSLKPLSVLKKNNTVLPH